VSDLDARSWRYAMPADAAGRARQVELARRDVVAFLHGRGAPAEATLDLEIVLGEACANVACHSGSDVMRVSVSAASCEACMVIEDDGMGFDPGSVPEPDMVSESGRGLHLMKELARTTIASGRCGTSVTARKEWRS